MLTITISAPSEEAKAFVRPSKLNVFAVDVSGSMGWTLGKLVDDTCSRIQDLPEGDAVLIGVFSSQGYFRWIATRELTTQADKDHVVAAIRRDMRIYGLTCFSEIIADTPQAIKPLLSKYQVVTFTFMSDGHPNAPIDSEARILEKMSDLRQYVTSSAVVAYGDYANRPLLGKMAKAIGGELVTAQTPEEVGQAFSKVAAGKARKKRRVSVTQVTSNPVIVFSLDADNSVAPVQPENGDYVVPDSARLISLNTIEIPTGPRGADEETLDYAAALALLAEGRIDEATRLMSAIGDVAIVNALYTAITNAELAKGEEMIRLAIGDTGARFTKGRVVGCLPPDDAFDLIDTLQLLQSDKECKFLPRHPGFVYKRIGRKSEQLPGYPHFHADKKTAVEFSKIVGNQKELNLSVLAKIPGTIELPETVTQALPTGNRVLNRDELGLPAVFDTFVFRNYAFVSNAMLSVPHLPAKLSANAFQMLQNVGVVPAGEFYDEDRIYVLDLTAVPACNKVRGIQAADWNKIAENELESLRLGSKIKVIKAKRNELDPQREADKPLDYTDDQLLFLNACGVKSDGSFDPPSEQSDPIDVLEVLIFEAKVKGGSSVSMKDFHEMIYGTEVNGVRKFKKMNFVGGLMNEGQKEIDETMPKTKGPAIEWCNQRLQELLQEQRAIDADTSARRYAVALGGHWAKHFDKDEATIQIGENQVSLSFRKSEKKI